MTEDKIRENRLRRMAGRQGLSLQRSRRRDPRAVDYAGYMLVDDSTNAVVLGGEPRPYFATMDEIEAYLQGDRRPTRGPTTAKAERKRAATRTRS